MNIRDEIITGSFAIGADGKKEPIDWKDYALRLEEKLSKEREVKICTGCGHLSTDKIEASYLACCPDNNYLSPLEYALYRIREDEKRYKRENTL